MASQFTRLNLNIFERFRITHSHLTINQVPWSKQICGYVNGMVQVPDLIESTIV